MEVWMTWRRYSCRLSGQREGIHCRGRGGWWCLCVDGGSGDGLRTLLWTGWSGLVLVGGIVWDHLSTFMTLTCPAVPVV